MNIGISSLATFSAAARGPLSLRLWLGHSSIASTSRPAFRSAFTYAPIGLWNDHVYWSGADCRGGSRSGSSAAAGSGPPGGTGRWPWRPTPSRWIWGCGSTGASSPARPGRRARRARAMPASRPPSGLMFCTASTQAAAANLPAGTKDKSRASPTWYVTAACSAGAWAWRSRAARISSAAASTPVASTPAAARARHSTPWPQATSSTRSPLAAASRRSVPGMTTSRWNSLPSSPTSSSYQVATPFQSVAPAAAAGRRPAATCRSAGSRRRGGPMRLFGRRADELRAVRPGGRGLAAGRVGHGRIGPHGGGRG